MRFNRNFSNLESNCCPDCSLPYFKYGVGYDRGIHCQNCGYTVPIEKYREVIKDFQKRINLAEARDEEDL